MVTPEGWGIPEMTGPQGQRLRACYFGDVQPESVASHKASSMKAHEMLNEGLMKACYHQ
jgi:hypothetical protein